MAQVHLAKVSKRYPDGFVAVNSIDLEMPDGEFTVLVGPSGCGKSTTLRMIAGLEQVSSGAITIGERKVNNLPPKDRDIAMVFQNYALYPHMSVFDNLAFALRLQKRSKSDVTQRVQRVAESLHIDALLARRPSALSGGQRQRVALGRAIVREPCCFLFDEPLSNLDAKLRVAMRAELRHLHQRLGTTSIYVTHDQEEAMTLGDRLVVMNRGEIQQVGSAIEVYRKPANRFVAQFVGSPPMSFVDGALRSEGHHTWFESAGIQVKLPIGTSREVSRDRQVSLGLRLEALEVRIGALVTSSTAIQGYVRLVQSLGNRTDVHVEVGPHLLLAQVDPKYRLKPGDPVVLSLNMAAAHLFCRGETGARLDWPPELASEIEGQVKSFIEGAAAR